MFRIQSNLFVPHPLLSCSHHRSQHKTRCLSLSKVGPFLWGPFCIPTINALQMFARITKGNKESVELSEEYE